MKDLPIGIQTFRKIRTQDYLYIDKTGYFDSFIKGGYYFFSRPRRFGKSLLISTLDALFQGQKELFEGLAVAKSGYEFPVHPVIRLDFSSIPNQSPGILEEEISLRLERIARTHGLTLTGSVLAARFRNLIWDMSERGPVVILIDEYDKPILDHLDKPDIADENRKKLREFYGVIKAMDEHLHLVFITGITRFTKVSIFSELNNLLDISHSVQYATLLGWTPGEMERDMKEHIATLAQSLGHSLEEMQAILAKMYNGYRFSRAEDRVYNPWSVINAFRQQSIENFWYASGSSQFLMHELNRRLKESVVFRIRDLYNFRIQADMLPTLDIRNAQLETLLFQAGYLTIKDTSGTTLDPYFHIGFPNREVEKSLLFALIGSLVPKTEGKADDHLNQLVRALHKEDLDGFFTLLRDAFFANIPYELHLPFEKYYQTVFHTLFLLLEIRIRSEESTNVGRIDGVLETDNHIYIIEFKLNDSAENALQQTRDKGYAQKYRASGKKIICVGVNFAGRNIDSWVHEVID